MDCRRALGLAAGLVFAALGCTHQQTVPQTPEQQFASSQKQAASPRQASEPSTDRGPVDNDQSRITPKPNTCVKAGALQECYADDKRLSSADRDQLLDRARRSYQQALSIDPNYLPAYSALAQLYEKLDDYEHAQATYSRALKVQPKAANIWFGMGMCQARHSQWESAIGSLRTACELDPENRQYVKTLGFSLARCGHYDEGLECLKQVVGEAEARCDLARMLHHLNQDDASRQQLQLALALKPQLESARRLQMDLTVLQVPPTPPPAEAPTSSRPVANVTIEGLN